MFRDDVYAGGVHHSSSPAGYVWVAGYPGTITVDFTFFSGLVS